MRILKLLAASTLSTVAVVVVCALFAIILAVVAFGSKFPSALAFYFIIWWLSLFIILPIAIRSQAEAAQTIPGTEPGAPILPRIRERAIMTTLLADILFISSVSLLPLAGL